jgi:hypothetical protein
MTIDKEKVTILLIPGDALVHCHVSQNDHGYKNWFQVGISSRAYRMPYLHCGGRYAVRKVDQASDLRRVTCWGCLFGWLSVLK